MIKWGKIGVILLVLAVWASPCRADLGGDAVVRVFPYNMEYVATGFYLEYRGKQYLVTNKHVCGIVYKLYHMDAPMAVYNVIAKSVDYDLCVLTVEKPIKRPFYLHTEPLKIGEVGFITGYPLGKRHEQIGIVSDLSKVPVAEHEDKSTCKPPRRYDDDYEVCVEDEIAMNIGFALIRPGNSGSPMYNSKREILGVVNAGDEDGHGVMVPNVFLSNFLNGVLP